MAREANDMVKINFYLDRNVLSALKWLAKSRSSTYSELLRGAAKQYVLSEIRQEQEDIRDLATAQEEAVG